MPDAQSARDVFEHPFNITIGQAQVRWGTPTTDMHGVKHEAGWVLPGGQRTQNRDVAETVAANIDRIISKQK